ncbi:oligoendopeptidase F [Dictyobacter formicarum]|uniref:Oligopeptidase F n=1 Tax=Dictyobacter formicarum TaxID=2778368 RepID=A0ABQ3V9E2_9CHLR|nr:oligoendopeptidase F [Dictyobacter formicarum]GHO82604.1 oligoendopeptidase F [Dictyobacter formicarum]
MIPLPVPKRSEVSREYTWDLESIFSYDEDWERNFQALEKHIPEFEVLNRMLTQSGQTLFAVLRTRDELFAEVERLLVYASMRRDEDNTRRQYHRMVDRSMQLYARIVTIASSIEPEILALPQTTVNHFLVETPGLQIYAHQLHDVNRRRLHVRSSEVEAVLVELGKTTDASETIFTIMSTSDLHLPTITDEAGRQVLLTKGNYQLYRQSADSRIRQQAFEKMHGAFHNHRHAMAAVLSSKVKSNIFYARQRGYDSCCQHALARYNIPLCVYDNMIDIVNEHIPLLNRYMKLRKRLLELDTLHMYDLYVPIMTPLHQQKISYQQACDTILEALAPLGEHYVSNLESAIKGRWIDVYETAGKSSGAYSSVAYRSHPFVFLNFQNDYDSMYTLAHELGHALHAFYSCAHQPYVYSAPTTFLAEVASTLNECLLTEHLFKTTSDPTKRLAILNHSLERFRGILFRQAMFAEFERQIHRHAEQDGRLTADILCSLYHTLNEKYYGAEVIVDELIDIEWARIPHFYRTFYVYQYATGFSAASALVQQLLRDGKPAATRYIELLCSGSSDYSIDLLKKAGVDITLHETVRRALALCEAHLSQLEQLVPYLVK